MDFDTRELELQGQNNPITADNMPSRSFGESFSLATESVLAVDNSDAEYNYFKDEVKSQSAKLSADNPTEKEFIDRFSLTYNDPKYNMPRKLIEDGSITYDAETKQFKGETSLARVYINKYQDALNDIIKYDGMVAKSGLLDRKGLVESSKKKAYKDYMTAETRLENTKGFVQWVAQFGGSMYGAIQDPVNIALLPFGGTATMTGKGLGAVAKTAGVAAWQEAKIAAVAEVPIQMQAYGWKNEIGVKWDVLDAVQSAAMSIGAASLIRAGGSATIDLTPMALDKLRAKAKADGDEALAEAVEEVADMQAKSSVKNMQDHLEAETVAYQQMLNDEPIDIDDIITESADLTDLGQRINGEKTGPSIKEVIDEIPEAGQPLYSTSMKPLDLEKLEPWDELKLLEDFEGIVRTSGYRAGDVLDLSKPTNEKGIRNAIQRYSKGLETVRDKEIVDDILKFMSLEGRQMMEDLQMKYEPVKPHEILNREVSDLEQYKAQELARTTTDDMTTIEKTLDEKGEVKYQEVSLKDINAMIDKDRSTIEKLMECAL